MSELTPQQVVSWLRAEGKKYNDMADDMERKFPMVNPQPVVRHKRVGPQSSGQADLLTHRGSVTVGDLEARIKYRSGRIDDLARHFGVSSEDIKCLLEPASKVYVGPRGWLKLRD